MITRNSVIKKVQKVLNNNPKIDRIFEPIIEEFCGRLAEQYNLNEYQLNDIIDQYNELEKMTFSMDLVNQSASGGFFLEYDYDNKGKKIKIHSKSIEFDTILLKDILLGDRKEIEGFINIAFHEQGHFIQQLIMGMCVNNGISQIKFRNGIKDIVIYSEQGVAINEYAEIINARRLTKGNLNVEEYDGYEDIQHIARTITSSLGISDEKLGDLQMKKNAREEYEQYIKQKVGNDYKECLIGMEDASDTISELVDLPSNSYSKINMAMQVETINEFSNEVLKRRIALLGKDGSVEDYARIVIDKKIRDENLLEAVKEYEEQLPEEFEINLAPDLTENIPIDKELLNQEIARIQEQENEKKQKAIEYNNDELIDIIIQLAQNYDLSKFPLKDIIKLTIYKNIGKIKRMFSKNKAKGLPTEETETTPKKREIFTNGLKERVASKKERAITFEERRKGEYENTR